MINPLETLLWLSLNVYFESRSDPPLAQIAVAHVTLNRMKQSGESAKYIVLKNKQFSWTNQKKDYFPYDLKSFTNSFRYVMIAVNGYDFTKGSTFYYKKGTKEPNWAKDKFYVAQFGSHKFYKNKE